MGISLPPACITILTMRPLLSASNVTAPSEVFEKNSLVPSGKISSLAHRSLESTGISFAPDDLDRFGGSP